jgi:hypothetical protein
LMLEQDIAMRVRSTAQPLMLQRTKKGAYAAEVKRVVALTKRICLHHVSALHVTAHQGGRGLHTAVDFLRRYAVELKRVIALTKLNSDHVVDEGEALTMLWIFCVVH